MPIGCMNTQAAVVNAVTNKCNHILREGRWVSNAPSKVA